jgi:hypothetical protein
VDGHACALGCLAEPTDVLADVEAGALRLDHPAVEGVRSDLAAEFADRDEPGLQAQPGGQQLVGLLESLVVGRLGGQVELPGTGEVAVDAFLRHELLDQVDRLGVGAVQPGRPLESQLGHRLPDADRHARRRHAAVAARRAEPDGVLLEEVHLRSAPSQMEGRDDAGQATPDDGDVDLTLHPGRRSVRRTGGRGIEPVGRELHLVSSGSVAHTQIVNC